MGISFTMFQHSNMLWQFSLFKPRSCIRNSVSVNFSFLYLRRNITIDELAIFQILTHGAEILLDLIDYPLLI